MIKVVLTFIDRADGTANIHMAEFKQQNYIEFRKCLRNRLSIQPVNPNDRKYACIVSTVTSKTASVHSHAYKVMVERFPEIVQDFLMHCSTSQRVISEFN